MSTEFDELFGGRVATGEGALRMDDILARSKPFDVDCHAALQEKGTSKPQTPSSTQILTSGTRNLDNDKDSISSNDEDVVDHLIIERQKGKRKASALAVKPMEPPP